MTGKWNKFDQKKPAEHVLQLRANGLEGTSFIRSSGQAYEVVAVKDHVRRADGQGSAILTWRTICPETRVAFEFDTGLKFKLSSLKVYAPGVWDRNRRQVNKKAALAVVVAAYGHQDLESLLADRVQQAFDNERPVCFSGSQGAWENKERLGQPFCDMAKLKLQKIASSALAKGLIRKDNEHLSWHQKRGTMPWLVKNY